MKVWECKVILPDDVELPLGADLPMRNAVRGAVEQMTERLPSNIFSGWGGKLTATEMEVAGIKDETPDVEMRDPDAGLTFRVGIEHLINHHSRENGSDTPDFILAEYLTDCLDAYDKALQRREAWYDRKVGSWQGGETGQPTEKP